MSILRKSSALALLTAVILAVAAAPVQAANIDWTGAAANGLWSDAGNWNAGVPTSADTAYVLTGTITLPAGTVVDGIVTWTPFDLTGGSLDVNGLNALGAGVSTIYSDLVGSHGLGVNGDVRVAGNNYLTGDYALWGTMRFASANSFGSGTSIGAWTNYSVVKLENGITLSGKTLALNNAGAVMAGDSNSNTWDGNVNIAGWSNGDRGISVDAGGTLTVTGAVNKDIYGNGDGGIIKTGDGTAVLNGGSDYTGVTQVTAGTLLVNGSATGDGAYTVNAGATLGGTGSISGAVSLSGNIAPGASAGLLQTGDMSWFDGASMALEIADAAGNVLAGDWDAVVVNQGIGVKTLDLTNLTAGGFAINVDTSAMVNFAGQDFIFAAAEGGVLGFDASLFTINGLSGYTVVLTDELGAGTVLTLSQVPEPGTLALLIAAGLGLAIWARKRK